jgi:hypothetical protein
LQEAVQSYWDARAKNKKKQIEAGKVEAGTRGEVLGGTQMGALEVLVADILCEAGLKRLDVRTRTALELPGYFRATKKWDLIVVSEGQLVLAMELKSYTPTVHFPDRLPQLTSLRPFPAFPLLPYSEANAHAFTHPLPTSYYPLSL